MGSVAFSVIGLLIGLVICAVVGAAVFFLCVVLAHKADYDVKKVTDLSNLGDFKGKLAEISAMFKFLRASLAGKLAEARAAQPGLAPFLSAKTAAVICFVAMIVFGLIPLRFTYGFSRVNFNLLWLLEIALLIAFTFIFAGKNFKLMFVPVAAYFVFTFLNFPARIIENGLGHFGSSFGWAFREFFNLSGVLFMLCLAAVAVVFFLTYFTGGINGPTIFIATCLGSVAVTFLGMCTNSGPRSILMIFDSSLWTFIAFVAGMIFLALGEESAKNPVPVAVSAEAAE